MLVHRQGGPRESNGPSIFCADWNTAVRGAEVHSLPLHFPLKKSRLWTAGTWTFQDWTVD